MSDEKKIPEACDQDSICRPLPILPLPPHPLCTVTITYPKGSPEQPMIAMDPKVCDSPEVALSILLTAILKANLP